MTTHSSRKAVAIIHSNLPPVELSSERSLIEFAEFHLQGATLRTVLRRISILNVLADKVSVRAVIVHACKVGLISKKRLQHLYASQTDSAVRGDPLFRLCDFATFVGRKGDNIFSFDELLLLEEVRHGSNNLKTYEKAPCRADVAFFVRDGTNRAHVSDSTLLRWSHCALDMNDAAIIDVDLIRRKIVRYGEDELRVKLISAAHDDPQENAVKVYLSLLLGKARRKGSVRETIADTIIELMLPTVPSRRIDFFEARNILALYLSNPLIPDDDKQWVKEKVQESCDIFARMYRDFVSDADSENPLRLKK